MSKVVKIEHEENEIALPVDKENLGRFVSSLLGQPQSVEKAYTLPFVANHEWFVHLIALITQRLQQQNDYKIITFYSEIKYTNGLKRELTSFEAFQHFSETLKVVSSGLKITLGVLVSFPNKDIPEKQEIDIRFSTSKVVVKRYLDDISDVFFSRKDDISGLIIVEIRHTERTWADDILGIIENSCEAIWVKESISKRFFKKTTAILKNDIILPILMLISLIPMISIFKKNRNKEYQEEFLSISDNYGNSSIEGIHEKINILANIEFEKYYAKDISFAPILIMIGVIFIYMVIIIVDKFVKPHPSFILLTKSTEKHMNDVIKKEKQKLIYFSVIGTIILGVLSSFIYDYLKNM